MPVGIDEVGRGSIAGPLLVGAVLLPKGEEDSFVESLLTATKLPVLKDSKKLTRMQRDLVFRFAVERLDWAVGEVSASKIDSLGLRPATDQAAGKALLGIRGIITRVIADAGLHHPFEQKYLTEFFVKGDERFVQISLASIMAKVTRDRIMQEYDQTYPGYGLVTNVGYGSPAHYRAIEASGLSPLHRRSFLKGIAK